jgi:hypothetical protein
MNVKLSKSETSINILLESIIGEPSTYFEKTKEWITKKWFFGLLNSESKKLTFSQPPDKIEFNFQSPVADAGYYVTGHSSIHFRKNCENTDIIINVETVGPRFQGKVGLGEYLNVMRSLEDYFGVLGIDLNKDDYDVLYPKEMVRKLVPEIRRNLLHDVLLISSIVLFFLVFQIVNSATIVFSLMSILMVFAFSYRDFSLYRQLSKVKYDTE